MAPSLAPDGGPARDDATGMLHIMLPRALADLVLLVHLAFIAFVMLGGLWALYWPRAPFVHLPAVAWGVWIELSGGICPLTPLENALRRAAGGAGYGGGFLDHYLLPLIYPTGLTPGVQVALATCVIVANALIYAGVWRRRRRRGEEVGA